MVHNLPIRPHSRPRVQMKVERLMWNNKKRKHEVNINT